MFIDIEKICLQSMKIMVILITTFPIGILCFISKKKKGVIHIDLNFMYANINIYIEAMNITLIFAFWGILCSVLIGLFCSLIMYYKLPILKNIVQLYIEISRNTPLLIQIFFLYYGLPKVGISISSVGCGIIGLAFLGGSYMGESIRSGLEAVSKSQIESGISLGLNQIQLIRHIILPQSLSVSLPSIGANCIFLLKETSILSMIAIGEVFFVTKDLIGMYYKTTEALVMMVISYSIMLIPLSIILKKIEKRSRFGTYGAK